MPTLLGLSHPTLWLILGLTLIALEALLVPGAYLIWIGLAALIMAALSALIPLSVTGELLAFGALCLLCAYLGWRLVYRPRARRDQADDPARDLHDPVSSLVGRVVPLHQAIIGGSGQIRIDDTIWRVTGPDLALGAPVRIVAVAGTLLRIEPVDRPERSAPDHPPSERP